MIFNRGNFQDHCRNCALNDIELSCECEVDDQAQPEDPNDESPKTRSDKTYKSTTINLSMLHDPMWRYEKTLMILIDSTIGFDEYLMKCFDNDAKASEIAESQGTYPIPLFSTISCIVLLVYGLVYGLVYFGHRLK